MELRRARTINTHPFSHLWPADNKEGGRIFDFSFIKTRSKHLKLVNPSKPWRNTIGWKFNKKKSEELVKKRGGRVAGYIQGEEG
jgi:hypothetical protein